MKKAITLLIWLVLCAGTTTAQVVRADGSELTRSWPGPDGNPLPFTTIEEVLEFLSTAKVKESRRTEEGTTGARKLLLERDGIQMHAVFRGVEVFKTKVEFADGITRLNFRDDAIFECAAYELAHLLEFRFVPPAVRRKVRGISGTVQAWAEDARMKKELGQVPKPPDPWLYYMQHQVMYVFDNLIYNLDRNLGNVLFMPDWKMVLIDHTRAFTLDRNLPKAEKIHFCERKVFEKLQMLDQQQLDTELGPFLTPGQIKALLQRRDRLVEHVNRLINKRGEDRVLFDFRGVERTR